jgi:hypothetical protein
MEHQSAVFLTNSQADSNDLLTSATASVLLPCSYAGHGSSIELDTQEDVPAASQYCVSILTVVRRRAALLSVALLRGLRGTSAGLLSSAAEVVVESPLLLMLYGCSQTRTRSHSRHLGAAPLLLSAQLGQFAACLRCTTDTGTSAGASGMWCA